VNQFLISLSRFLLIAPPINRCCLKDLERIPENGGSNQGNNLITNGGCELEKSNGSSEGINSTIVSVEPETSFGDMTMDSIKDHLA